MAGAGGRGALAVACFAAVAAAASGWARPPPPSPAAIAPAPGHASPCPGSPTRLTAPCSARPQGPGCGWGMEGEPDLHQQGGFHPGRGFLDQGPNPLPPKVTGGPGMATPGNG